MRRPPYARPVDGGTALARSRAARSTFNLRGGERAMGGAARQCGRPVRHACGTRTKMLLQDLEAVASLAKTPTHLAQAPGPPKVAADLAMARPNGLRKLVGFRAWTHGYHVSGLRSVSQLPDEMFLHLLFSQQHSRNTVAPMSAHMDFVAGVCQAQRSLLEGMNL